MIIRQETAADYAAVEALVERAFSNAEHADGDEHRLVARLRESSVFVPELSLVAEENGKLVGYSLLTKLEIRSEKTTHSLALAPVAVDPACQSGGIGGQLIREGLARAKALGFASAVVLGHADYYPRFGFQPASHWGIRAPFEVPDDSFLALELREGALKSASGEVCYDKAFFPGEESSR